MEEEKFGHHIINLSDHDFLTSLIKKWRQDFSVIDGVLVIVWKRENIGDKNGTCILISDKDRAAEYAGLFELLNTDSNKFEAVNEFINSHCEASDRQDKEDG